MAKVVSSFELTLNECQPRQTLESWLYVELRGAILEGRLKPGARLPASRDFAGLHRLSRGIVVTLKSSAVFLFTLLIAYFTILEPGPMQTDLPVHFHCGLAGAIGGAA